MASLVQWLRANKISLNTKKTEIGIFKTQHTNFSKKTNKNHGLLPTIFHKYFNSRTTCGHNPRSVTYNTLIISLKQTTKHGINSIT